MGAGRGGDGGLGGGGRGGSPMCQYFLKMNAFQLTPFLTDAQSRYDVSRISSV